MVWQVSILRKKLNECFDKINLFQNYGNLVFVFNLYLIAEILFKYLLYCEDHLDVQIIGHNSTLLLMGVWVFRTPSKFLAFKQSHILKCFMLTFPIYLFTNKISKKNWIFLRVYPPFSPLKSKASQKWPPMTAYNPHFYSRIQFYYKNGGVCKKL